MLMLTSFLDSLTWGWDLDENNVSETLLGIIGDTNGTDVVLNGDPLMLFGVSLGYDEENNVLVWSGDISNLDRRLIK